jgi:hypothetical protein
LTTTPCADDWLNVPRKNPFGKKPEEVALMLKLNREDDRPANSIDPDAARPLKDGVDDILAQCRIF